MTSSELSLPSAAVTPARHYILGTAGHIDHGKTSLVRALTGTDPDRLPEERRRGMTIELGFAQLTVGDIQFGVVDVPGHERFVRTMVSGATGIDIAVLVVAADDSVMPQTIEHVEILNLLGVRRAVVALTKVDVVDREMVELVSADIHALLSATALADAPVCPVSSVTEEGLEELKHTLARVADSIERTPPQRPFRLAVDRVFTIQGRGTVVTGSVLRGVVEAGEILELLPGGEEVRVRGLHTHGAAVDAAGRGQRAAINLSGVDRERIERGHELATPGYLQPAHVIDVRLHCLTSCAHGLKSTGVVRLDMGTREVPVRVVLYESVHLEPGGLGYAQLRSGEPLAAAYGQRFILRDESAMRTIGGGAVLAPVGRRKRRDAASAVQALQSLHEGGPADRVEQALRTFAFQKPSDLHLCAQSGVELSELPAMYEHLRAARRWVPVTGTDVYVVPAAIEDLANRLVAWLERHHRAHPEEPGRKLDSVMGWLERLTSRALAKPLFDTLLRTDRIKTLGRFVCASAFAPALTGADEKLLTAMLEEVRAGGFQPPALDALKTAGQADRKRLERLATLAVALGELVQIEPKMYLHREAEQELQRIVQDLISDKGSATVAEIREALNSSRKYVVPFVEYLDRIGFTKRVDDRRVLAAEVKKP